MPASGVCLPNWWTRDIWTVYGLSDDATAHTTGHSTLRECRAAWQAWSSPPHDCRSGAVQVRCHVAVQSSPL
jgi:hypothetical protein